MLRGAIWDLDGTILDSMSAWDHVGENYLRSQGIEPEPDLDEAIATMSLHQAADYFIEHYGVKQTRDEVIKGAVAIVDDFYRYKAQLKPHLKEFLAQLHETGVKMCIATATERSLVEAALSRCGVLDETSYEVKISEVAQVIEVEIVNEYVHGNIKLTKVDEDYPDNKLTGATFEVYKDVNGDGKLDDGDELIGTLTETTTGIYEMKELLYGKYLVRETKAPEGFELDKGVYSVFIEKDENTYEVENKAGVGFINTAMKGNLKIVKTSSDGKVEGFTFRVTGVNGYDRSFTTDKNGEIIIEGLRIGDYTISEVQDSVSASYVLPADKIATVKVGSTTVVEMHNELRDTPKTGDNSNVGLWTALAGLSALGIVGTAIIAYRKKKKEDNE